MKNHPISIKPICSLFRCINYSNINIAINFRKNYPKLKMKYEERDFTLLLYWLHCRESFRPFEMVGILLFHILNDELLLSFIRTFLLDSITMIHESVYTFVSLLNASPVYRAFNVIQRKHWFLWPGYTHVRFKRVN